MDTYLLIADVITAIKNDKGESHIIDEVVEGLAETFEQHDPDFDKVQFLSDCELAEGNDNG